jgi:hypothetical protein
MCGVIPLLKQFHGIVLKHKKKLFKPNEMKYVKDNCEYQNGNKGVFSTVSNK